MKKIEIGDNLAMILWATIVLGFMLLLIYSDKL